MWKHWWHRQYTGDESRSESTTLIWLWARLPLRNDDLSYQKPWTNLNWSVWLLCQLWLCKPNDGYLRLSDPLQLEGKWDKQFARTMAKIFNCTFNIIKGWKLPIPSSLCVFSRRRFTRHLVKCQRIVLCFIQWLKRISSKATASGTIQRSNHLIFPNLL